ncbi:MAG: hypothetical protein SO066_00010 [Proteus mirabilis]|nr:hypothetical protein [Proteus mirabilis]
MKNKIKDNKKDPSERMLDELVQDIFVSSIDDKFKDNSNILTEKINELSFNLNENIKGVNNKISSHKKSFEALNSTTNEIKSSLTSISLEEEKRHQLVQEILNSKTDKINKQINKLQEDAIVQNDKIICKVKESDVLLVENKKKILENINLLKNYLDTHFNEIRKELINKADEISYEHNAYFDKELTHLAEILTSKSEEHKHLLECHINDGVYLIEENILQYLKERDRKVDEKSDKLGNKIEEKQLISNEVFLNSTEKSKQERENIVAKIAYNDKKSKNRFLCLSMFLVIQTALIIFLILKQYGLLN